MSHTSAAPLRTTYWVFQIGSKLARSACGTKRSVRAAARWEIAGAASALVAIAPAAVFRNALRCMTPPTRLQPVGRNKPPGPAGACHRAGRRPDPVGRPDDKLRALRRFIANTLAEVCRDAARLSHHNGAMRCAYCALRSFTRSFPPPRRTAEGL